jgi:hypothetical protein
VANFTDRENYIPIRQSELVTFMCDDTGPGGNQRLSPDEQQSVRRLTDLIAALFHHQYHRQLQALKDEYAPFDPDADTKYLKPPTEAERSAMLERLFTNFTHLMEKANYKRLTREEIQAATETVSEWGLNMDVDFDVFERIEIFSRGDAQAIRTKRNWRKWFALEEVKVPAFQRMVLILKQKPHKRLGPDADTKNVLIKAFKDIPKMDIEMILPGTKVKMPTLDRYKLGGSLAAAVGFVGYKLASTPSVIALLFGITTFNVTAINPMSLYGPAALVGGYGYKQYAGFQQTKQQYAFKLVQSLFYQNLDNNQGVLFRQIDEAEEQECREAFLAYFYLWRYAGEQGWTSGQLDDYIEIELERRANLKIDFEVKDGLEKLVQLQLVERIGERYKAVPLAQGLEILDRQWDNLYQYNRG